MSQIAPGAPPSQEGGEADVACIPIRDGVKLGSLACHRSALELRGCDAQVRIAAHERHSLERLMKPLRSMSRSVVDAVAAADPTTPASTGGAATDAPEPPHRNAARYVWALLLARIYEVLPLLCPKCGGVLGYRLRLCLRHKMRIIAFITEGAVIREILGHLGEPTSPPRLRPARGPPLWEMPGVDPDEGDPQAQPTPNYEFDQRIAW